MRYHGPVYGVFNFIKPKSPFFFTGQALVDGSQKDLPANSQRFTGTTLSSITIMQAEVLDV